MLRVKKLISAAANGAMIVSITAVYDVYVICGFNNL